MPRKRESTPAGARSAPGSAGSAAQDSGSHPRTGPDANGEERIYDPPRSEAVEPRLGAHPQTGPETSRHQMNFEPMSDVNHTSWRAADRGTADELREPTESDWQSENQDSIEAYLKTTEDDYFIVVEDYLNQAELATERYKELSASHVRWRFGLIIATGILAAINVMASLELISKSKFFGLTLPAMLNAFAAIYAGGLTLFGNLENFFNKGEKAAGFRESREILLTKYREYYFKWRYYVQSFGMTPTACLNAGRLYRELVRTDRELRSKLTELTSVPEGKAGPSQRGHRA